MKKAQTEHIFIYVMTGVLVSLIFIYGYKAITDFRQKTEDIGFIKFRNEIVNAIKNIYSEYSTVEIRGFDVPQTYNEVCFVETKNTPLPATTNYKYKIIEDSITSGENKNVFLISNRVVKKSFYIEEKISVGNTQGSPILCIDSINSKIKLRLEGKGDYALIGKA